MQDEKGYLIIYLDDNGKISKVYSKTLEIKGSLVCFQSDNNQITIPSTRLLKIKEKLKGDDNEAG